MNLLDVYNKYNLKESVNLNIDNSSSEDMKDEANDATLPFGLNEHKFGEYLYNNLLSDGKTYQSLGSFSILKDTERRTITIHNYLSRGPLISIPIEKIPEWKYTKRVSWPERHQNEVISGFDLHIYEKYEKNGEQTYYDGDYIDVVAPSGKFSILLRELEISYDFEKKNYYRDSTGKAQREIVTEHKTNDLEGWMSFTWNDIPFEYKIEIIEKLQKMGIKISHR